MHAAALCINASACFLQASFAGRLAEVQQRPEFQSDGSADVLLQATAFTDH